MIDVFNDGRLVLSHGDEIKMIHYRQEEDTEKAQMLLEEHLLCFILQGHKTVWHPHGKLQIQPGEGFFLAKGNYLRAERKMDPQLGYQSLVVRLSDAFLFSLEDTFRGGEQAASQVFHLREDVLVKGLVHQLVQYFQTPEEKKRMESLLLLKMRELLLLLLSASVNRGFGAVIKGLPSHKEPSLVTLMEAHFRETLTLEQWAFLAGLSLSSFKRKFEVTYHMPPRRWIQQRRLEEAWYLLGNRRMNVTEVCFSVGFENLAHFVHAFKEKYHITPKQRQVSEPTAI